MANCKTCGGRLTWRKVGKKWHALDPDGGNHWSHCRGTKAPKPLEIRTAGVTVGERYVPACGKCDVPPWEFCACSALLPSTSDADAMPTHSECIADRINAEADAQLAFALAEERN